MGERMVKNNKHDDDMIDEFESEDDLEFTQDDELDFAEKTLTFCSMRKTRKR